jgi:hypothetical protein
MRGGLCRCYAMDVMLNCYEGRNEPKFSHLSNLHRSIALVAEQLLDQASPIVVQLTAVQPATHHHGGGGGSLSVETQGTADCSSAGILQWPKHPGACSGLKLDTRSKDAHSCAIACCSDPKCVVWQMEPTPSQECWRGRPTSCGASPLKPASGVRPGTKPSPSPAPPGKTASVRAFVYNSTAVEVVVLMNTADIGSTNWERNRRDTARVTFRGSSYTICAGSSILLREGVVVFNSSIDGDGPTVQAMPQLGATTNVERHFGLAWKAWREPIVTGRRFDPSIGDINRSVGSPPLDQVHVSNDTTDYMWYTTHVSFGRGGARELQLSTGIANAFLVFLDGMFVGAQADYSHTGMHGATRSDPRSNLTFVLNTSTAGTHRLDLLSVSMGLNNWLGVEDNCKSQSVNR